ncbi:hypothetical protein BG006_009513 [Podila minutissima]|uniref:Uncharacterized protein n=1 Tax=Podila minutissima TaxID=64525 RepID=A0A9P5SH97_9FUNG|nr:hypothetical protein BG006_009513 [Podila minutissima]
MQNVATLAAGATVDTCEGYLQGLHIGGCGNMSSNDLQAVLCKARQLEKFVAIDKDNIFFQDPTLSNDKQTHRKVYQQLGAQSNLEQLIIDHPLDPGLNDSLFQLNSLDLTLESGPQELEGLVQLQELSVMSLAHGIGVPELNWMAQH